MKPIEFTLKYTMNQQERQVDMLATKLTDCSTAFHPIAPAGAIDMFIQPHMVVQWRCEAFSNNQVIDFSYKLVKPKRAGTAPAFTKPRGMAKSNSPVLATPQTTATVDVAHFLARFYKGQCEQVQFKTAHSDFEQTLYVCNTLYLNPQKVSVTRNINATLPGTQFFGLLQSLQEQKNEYLQAIGSNLGKLGFGSYAQFEKFFNSVSPRATEEVLMRHGERKLIEYFVPKSDVMIAAEKTTE